MERSLHTSREYSTSDQSLPEILCTDSDSRSMHNSSDSVPLGRNVINIADKPTIIFVMTKRKLRRFKYSSEKLIAYYTVDRDGVNYEVRIKGTPKVESVSTVDRVMRLLDEFREYINENKPSKSIRNKFRRIKGCIGAYSKVLSRWCALSLFLDVAGILPGDEIRLSYKTDGNPRVNLVVPSHEYTGLIRCRPPKDYPQASDDNWHFC
jgi:hypothetical protein